MTGVSRLLEGNDHLLHIIKELGVLDEKERLARFLSEVEQKEKIELDSARNGV